MPTAVPVTRDLVRDEVLRLIKRTGATPKDIIQATGMSKNTIYPFLAGKQTMKSGNSTAIIKYLRKRRTKA